MTPSDQFPTIRMQPVPGVGQACRIVHLPGAGNVVLEGPADVLAIVRLVPHQVPPVRIVQADVDDLGAVLDVVRAEVWQTFGTPSSTTAAPPT